MRCTLAVRGPDPLPLVLTHGWPGSYCEYLELIPLLTDPEAHGGDASDAFHAVVPSLPGFGFSSAPPPGGLVAEQVGQLWHRLMVDGLGYPHYAAHGSDLGAGVTVWLARIHPETVLSASTWRHRGSPLHLDHGLRPSPSRSPRSKVGPPMRAATPTSRRPSQRLSPLPSKTPRPGSLHGSGKGGRGPGAARTTAASRHLAADLIILDSFAILGSAP